MQAIAVNPAPSAELPLAMYPQMLVYCWTTLRCSGRDTSLRLWPSREPNQPSTTLDIAKGSKNSVAGTLQFTITTGNVKSWLLILESSLLSRAYEACRTTVIRFIHRYHRT